MCKSLLITLWFPPLPSRFEEFHFFAFQDAFPSFWVNLKKKNLWDNWEQRNAARHSSFLWQSRGIAFAQGVLEDLFQIMRFPSIKNCLTFELGGKRGEGVKSRESVSPQSRSNIWLSGLPPWDQTPGSSLDFNRPSEWMLMRNHNTLRRFVTQTWNGPLSWHFKCFSMGNRPHVFKHNLLFCPNEKLGA